MKDVGCHKVDHPLEECHGEGKVEHGEGQESRTVGHAKGVIHEGHGGLGSEVDYVVGTESET